MTFEEFFKKKKISLTAFEQGEPELFSEFKIHYDLMGEKSFDHTKKYWFNKLRLRFPAPFEPKVEKVVMENQLAEQTITESLIESSAPAPKVGFKPMFKAKPTHGTGSDTKNPSPAESATVTPEVNEAAATKDQNPAFEQEKRATQQLADTTARTTDREDSAERLESKPAGSAETPTPPTVGFKPRFKAGVTKPAETEPEKKEEAPAPENPAPALSVGFKPRFKAGVTKPAAPEEPKVEEAPKEENTDQPKPAIGFKPRFKAGVTKPAESEPEKKEEEPTPLSPDTPASASSIGFKPRFKAGVTKPAAPENKPKSPEEE